MSNNLNQEELKNLQTLTQEFNKIKTQLGDLELQKHGMCLRVENIKIEFQALEAGLTDKYGKDSIINMETGEVKDKEVLEESK
jgi:hypothetical protein|tara:strand:+ start:43500 stop:43748 length:249 start_codon:yes stop_codon:yes gene_type:complete